MNKFLTFVMSFMFFAALGASSSAFAAKPTSGVSAELLGPASCSNDCPPEAGTTSFQAEVGITSIKTLKKEDWAGFLNSATNLSSGQTVYVTLLCYENVDGTDGQLIYNATEFNPEAWFQLHDQLGTFGNGANWEAGMAAHCLATQIMRVVRGNKVSYDELNHAEFLVTP